ncbi:hypothetical protein C8F01DRAFT_1349235 [Mycena amicta]|nr:hypothetical protein C8F01DRAFT_1349235 [Mycena amicta]
MRVVQLRVGIVGVAGEFVLPDVTEDEIRDEELGLQGFILATAETEVLVSARSRRIRTTHTSKSHSTSSLGRSSFTYDPPTPTRVNNQRHHNRLPPDLSFAHVDADDLRSALCIWVFLQAPSSRRDTLLVQRSKLLARSPLEDSTSSNPSSGARSPSLCCAASKLDIMILRRSSSLCQRETTLWSLATSQTAQSESEQMDLEGGGTGESKTCLSRSDGKIVKSGIALFNRSTGLLQL